jgi:hypothetical protein
MVRFIFKVLFNLKIYFRMKNVVLYCFIVFSVLLFDNKIAAQSMVDISVGTSHQDAFFTNLAYRYQVSEKFRIGIETQFGVPKYRLIDAKVIKEGYSSTTSIPLTLRLYEKEQIRLDLYTKIGARFQGVLDPDKNDNRDSLLTSTALAFEPGLLVTVKLNDKLNLQSGVTFPLLFQFQPSALFENLYPAFTHLSLNQKIGTNSILFVKSAFGPALGGSGDTQKFGKSIQAGIRLNFGKKENPSFVEPSF